MRLEKHEVWFEIGNGRFIPRVGGFTIPDSRVSFDST